ncbi:MAG: dienelactone hydrolase family protein [Clostridia bacterium]|nr:dienelactone hydrolase family protein [Clostridia bacterium]
MNFEFKEIANVKCAVRYPDGFEEKKKYPVILCLHGAGSRGDDPCTLKENYFFVATEKIEKFPFVSVMPLCPENQTWFDLLGELKALVDEILGWSFIKGKIFLMGASMGGYGSWQLAMSVPEKIGAVAAACGGGMYWNAKTLQNVPAWAFHGKEDTIVLCEESIKMVNFINRFGGRARITLYDGVGHESWQKAYCDQELYKWFLRNI